MYYQWQTIEIQLRSSFATSDNDLFLSAGDAPIIGSVIGNADYRLIFSYRLSDRYVYQISSRSDIICGQSQSIGN